MAGEWSIREWMLAFCINWCLKLICWSAGTQGMPSLPCTYTFIWERRGRKECPLECILMNQDHCQTSSLISISWVPSYSGKLLREKTFANWRKIRFSWRKLLQIAHWCHRQKMPCPSILQGKLFWIATKPAKVFSPESFLLYGSQRSLRCHLIEPENQHFSWGEGREACPQTSSC